MLVISASPLQLEQLRLFDEQTNTKCEHSSNVIKGAVAISCIYIGAATNNYFHY